ncbi:Protein CBG14416 [Caenorhabditis briggsae]|uniref:Protein CBG14416 n=1 Tax=Caenorhabditis briggsae TaxID=6238 RepID=A8XJY0_CAEBR|nr:Protein CBG14416 [Caenorhabditis briggsae]CAP32956.2 Protein CBG14416 [Caenorhabditis briggsae]
MRRPFFLFILFNLSLPAAVSGEFLERSDAYGRIWESRTPPDGMKQDVSHNHLVFVFLAFLVLSAVILFSRYCRIVCLRPRVKNASRRIRGAYRARGHHTVHYMRGLDIDDSEFCTESMIEMPTRLNMGKYSAVLTNLADGRKKCNICNRFFNEQKDSGTNLYRYHFKKKHPAEWKKVSGEDTSDVEDDGPPVKKPALQQKSIPEMFSDFTPDGQKTASIERAVMQLIAAALLLLFVTCACSSIVFHFIFVLFVVFVK